MRPRAALLEAGALGINLADRGGQGSSYVVQSNHVRSFHSLLEIRSLVRV